MASAHREDESLKKHGDVMERALEDMDRHGAGKNADPIPMPERGSHEKSHAAHPGDAMHDHTKPAGNVRKSADQGERREPPQEIGRIGKEHRKQ